MQRKWEQCKARMLGAKQGDHVVYGRWWNVEWRGMSVMENKSLLLLVLVFLGFRRKWWCSYSECPLLNREVARQAARADGGEGIPDVDDEDAADAASGESDDAKDDGDGAREGGPSAVRMSTAQARDTVRERRKKTMGALHFSAIVLNNQTSCRIVEGMCRVARPLMRRFGVEEKSLTSRAGTLALHQGLAHGDFEEPLREMLAWFCSPAFAQVLGMSADRTSGHQRKSDAMVANTLWALTAATVGHLSVYSMLYLVPPLCLIGLSSDSGDAVNDLLLKLRGMFDAAIRLLHGAVDSKQCAGFVKI